MLSVTEQVMSLEKEATLCGIDGGWVEGMVEGMGVGEAARIGIGIENKKR